MAPFSRIAFIGLGKMGLPMARRLLAAGFSVSGFDPASAAMADFIAAGGAPAASAAEAVRGADAVITMLPDGAIVAAVVLADDMRVALSPGALLLEMSSSAPLATRQLGEALKGLGVAVIDAPVSGGVKRAVDGSLAIMVGGEDQDIARARPLLDAMGRNIFPTGMLGTAHAMKALNNYVSAAGLIAACEALRIGAGFGLDPEIMTDILNASTGRNNATENKLKQFVLSRSYASGFGLALMTKDVGIADQLGRELGIEAPLSHDVADFCRAALAALGEGGDHTEVDRYLAVLNKMG